MHSGLKNEAKPKLKRNMRRGIVGGMVGIILLILGGLSISLLTSNPPPGSTTSPAPGVFPTATTTNINHPDNAAGAPGIIVGPPDHQLDIAYPSAIPLSMNGADIPTPNPPEHPASAPTRVMGAFATTDSLTDIENYYSKKLQAAGYKWDWEDACGQDTKINCPESRYFTAGIVKCVTPETGNASSICSSAYQVNFWLIGKNATPTEYKVMNIPQSIFDQLKPGQTLVGYSANPLNPVPANVTMAVTTAAAVPTPTQLPVPTAYPTNKSICRA